MITVIDCFIGTTLFFSALAFLGWCAVYGKDEGTLSNSIILNFFAGSYAFIFPLTQLFSIIGTDSSVSSFYNFLGLISLNVLLYSILASYIIYSLTLNKEKMKPFRITFISLGVSITLFFSLLAAAYFNI